MAEQFGTEKVEQKFKTPQEELDFLRAEVAKHEKTILDNNQTPIQEEVIKSEIEKHSERNPEEVLHKDFALKPEEVKAIVLDLAPEEHDDKMAEIVSILQDKGILNALAVIEKLKENHVNLLSQTVLLKGVNDNVETLQKLFLEITKNGIRPYYLHQNDPVYWAKHFTVPIKRAIKIWQQLRPRISGIVGTAKFVIDTPYGYGKVPIPEAGWEVEYSHFKDFHNTNHKL